MEKSKIDNKDGTDQDQVETTDLTLKKSCFEDCPELDLSSLAPIHVECFKTLDKREVYLHLFSNMIVRSSERTLSKSGSPQVLRFSFDVAFYVKRADQSARKYSAIKFVNMSTKLSETFYQMSTKLVNTWAALLANYTNQIGIQEYFKTVKVLGKGVSAEVYLAQRASDGKLFAVKAFNKVKNNKKCQDAFENQIRTLRILNHPNIIKLYNVFISSEFIYAVIDYLPGGTLFDEVKLMQSAKARYSTVEERRVAHNLVSGLENLRIKRIVHRDIKLENILIRPATSTVEKAYIICDFGLATWIDQESYIFQKCGTPGYIAPEILRAPKGQKIKIDCKVDIFSLGCIIHVVMLCRTVFQYSGDCKNLIKLNKLCEIDYTAKRYESLNRQQVELLQMMLEPDPAERLTSDVLLKMSYFKKFKRQSRIMSKVGQKRQDQIEDISKAPTTIIRSTDRMGSVEVKQQKKSAFTRNASLNKNITFTDAAEQSKTTSFFDFFTRKKVNNNATTITNHDQIKLKMKEPATMRKEAVRQMLHNL